MAHPKTADEEVLARIDTLDNRISEADEFISEAERRLAGLRADRADLARLQSEWRGIACSLGLVDAEA